jgi:hypothetical protein
MFLRGWAGYAQINTEFIENRIMVVNRGGRKDGVYITKKSVFYAFYRV